MVGPPSLDAMAEQVDLDDARKREILDTERAIEGANHFEVLGLLPGASPEQVKLAFHEASRRFHPDRYFTKELGSFQERIERIFKRMAEANAVLTQERRREAYLKAHPELRGPPGRDETPVPRDPESEARAAERRARMARHPYLARPRMASELVAEARMLADKGELSHAFTQLNNAVRLDPKNREAQRLLEEIRRKNDEQRGMRDMDRALEWERQGDLARAAAGYRAAASSDPRSARASAKAAQLMLRLGEDLRDAKTLAQHAVELEPRSTAYRTLLGNILLEAGMKKLARKEFEEAVKHDPENAEAKAQLRKLRWTF